MRVCDESEKKILSQEWKVDMKEVKEREKERERPTNVDTPSVDPLHSEFEPFSLLP